MPDLLLDQLKDRLRTAGLRATPARVAVLRYFVQTGGPLTHAELVDGLDGQGWDRATLYRNLTDLAGSGMLKRSDMGDHLWRYELVTDDPHTAELHPHFMCTSCGDISCLPDGLLAVNADPRLPKALLSGAVEVQVRGRCDNCIETAA